MRNTELYWCCDRCITCVMENTSRLGLHLQHLAKGEEAKDTHCVGEFDGGLCGACRRGHPHWELYVLGGGGWDGRRAGATSDLDRHVVLMHFTRHLTDEDIALHVLLPQAQVAALNGDQRAAFKGSRQRLDLVERRK